MRDLIDRVLVAHGGIERWQTVSSIAAQGRLSGLLPKRFSGNQLATFSVEVHVAERRTILLDFPEAGKRAIFDRGDVRIETADGETLESRSRARSLFFGFSGLRRNLYWDPLDVAYFAGYAFWNYLTSPILLTNAGITVTEADPLPRSEQQWRQLQATFPANIDTHCRQQTFYVDADGLIRRHDFIAEPIGKWARAALYCDRHREFERAHLSHPTARLSARFRPKSFLSTDPADDRIRRDQHDGPSHDSSGRIP